jgi:hypothetical protein
MTKVLLKEGFAFGAASILLPHQITESDQKVIRKYGKAGEQNPVLVGICQMSDEKNGNGRVYPRSILEREIEKYMDKVKKNMASGELDHPDSSEVSLDRVSHRIIDMWWDDNKVMCKTMILDNPKVPKGRLAAGLIEEGFTLGISSRGLGSVKEDYRNGGSVVEEDFSLICFDLVSEPSTPGAYQYPEKSGFGSMSYSSNLNAQEQQELAKYLNKESKEYRINNINNILDDILRG